MTDSVARLERGNGSEAPRLTGRVNLESVTSLIDEVDALFGNGKGNCTIDLSGVEESDSATVALLLEWKRRAEQQGCHLAFTSIPERLLDIARISQLEGILAG